MNNKIESLSNQYINRVVAEPPQLLSQPNPDLQTIQDQSFNQSVDYREKLKQEHEKALSDISKIQILRIDTDTLNRRLLIVTKEIDRVKVDSSLLLQKLDIATQRNQRTQMKIVHEANADDP